jgi:protein ImuB
VIAAVNRAAERAGLRTGERVANARAKAEGLQVRPIDHEADRAALHRLALWAMRYTPAVSAWGPENGGDGFFLDVTGAAHLFGGEVKLLDDISQRLASFGLRCRLAIAATPGMSWALSHFHPRQQEMPAETEEEHALHPLPIEALRLAPATSATLRRLGFKTVGALADKARAPFAARFEKELLTRLDQALGRASEPLVFIAPPPIYSSLRQLLEPIATQDAIITVARRLMDDLVPRLVRDGAGGRRFELRLFRVDGDVLAIQFGTALPTRNSAHVARLAALKLERLAIETETGFGFEAFRLTVLASESINPAQKDFDTTRESTKAESETLLLDSIGERIGPRSVMRLMPFASHLPERSQYLGPAPRQPCASWPSSGNGRWRPLFLLSKAEETEVLAILPEGPPKRFRWRGRTHGVAHSQGPERIEGEWWRSPQPLRDYYLVEDDSGHRFWLYREGLYGEKTAPRWFVHGLFA